MLATVNWIGGSGDWNAVSNWSDGVTNRLPGPSDDAVIDVANGITVTHSSGSHTVKSLTLKEAMTVSGGSLTLSAASVFEGGLVLSGGSLFANGILTTSGTTTWSDGTIQGTGTVHNSGQWTLSGANVKSISGILENAGTIVHAGTGNLQLAIGATNGTLNNLAGGLYDLQGDADFTFGVFNNAGTMRKSAGTGLTTSLSGNIFNNLGGTIDVRSGNVAIVGSTGLVVPSHTGGNYLVAQGSTLDLTSGASNVRQIFTGNYTSSGDGLLRLNGGAVIVGPGGATFNFAACEWADGRIDGGPDGLTNAGVLTLASTNGMPLVNSLINSGTIIHGATAGDLGNGSFASPGSGTLTNLAGAVYDFQVDKQIAIETFINRGTLRKSAGAGTAFMSTRNFSNEGGTIDVQSGTLQISGPLNSMDGGLSTGGFFTVDAGAVLDLTSSGQTVRYSGTYTGSGAGTVRVRAGTLQVGPAGATFNLPPGLFNWTGGRISGGAAGLTNVGSMALAGSDNKLLNGLLNNAGAVTHMDLGDLELGASFPLPEGTFNNLAGGLYDLQGDAGFSNGAFNNAGTLRKSAGAEFSITFHGHRFNNVGGTIDVRKGSFVLQGTSGSAGFPNHTGGIFTVAAGAFLDLDTEDGSQVFTGNYTGSGEGMVRILGNVASGNAVIVGAGGSTLDFPPGLLHWMDAVIDGRAAPLTNRGSMTVNVSSGPWVRLRGTLNNAGSLLHVGNGVISIDGDSGLGNLTNLAGGVYEFQGNGTIQHNGPGAAVHNYGTLRKASGTSTATIDTDLPFDNVGTVEVNAGRLLVKSRVAQVLGRQLRGGTWKVQADGLLQLEADPRIDLIFPGTAVVLDGASSRFPAIEHVDLNGGSLTLLGGRRLTTHVNRFVGGLQTGLTSTEAVAFDPSVGNLFVYQGSTTQIREYTRAGIEVLPRIPVPGGPAVSLDLDMASAPLTIGGTAVPAGTLLVVNGSDRTLFGIDRDTGAVLASVPLPVPFATILGGSYHAGRNTMFLVDSSTVFEMDPATGVLLQSIPVQPAGSPTYTLSHGDLEVDPVTGNLLVVGGTAGGFVLAIRELMPTGQFVRDHDIDLLTDQGLSGIAIDETTRHLWVGERSRGAVHEVGAQFVNGGNLTLGVTSTLDVPGTYTQTGDGTIATHVGGNPASGQFGRVTSTGPAKLDGTFGVNLVNGFAPTAGQQFPIVTYASVTSSFTQFTGLSGGRLPLFSVDQLPTSVVLNAVGSGADLTLEGFVAATFPTTATPGQTVSVTYDVRNRSQIVATGEWVDSLYLSRGTTLDENAVLLGRVQHRGGVAGLSSYGETLTAPLPPLVDGPYHVLVLIDSRGLVLEANRANNLGFSTATIAVTVPVLTLGTPVMSTIANGQDRYYRLVALPGKDLKITGDFSATGVAETYVRYGELPDRANFDQASSANDQQQRLVIGSPQGGSYYVLVHGREGQPIGSPFTLRAEGAGFEIVRLSPLRGSNLGLATIEVIGSQFTPQTTLSLHHDFGAMRTAQSVQFVDANRLRATFDLEGLTPDAYRVHADDPGAPGTTIALDTFTVTNQPSGIVSLSIISPAFVRVGMPIFVDITIDNGNDSFAVAPILEVVATNVAAGQEDQIVYGQGLDALPGVLPPLYNGDLGATYDPKPHADGQVSTFNLMVINPSTTLINWDSQKENLRPSTIPADAWDAIWANFRPVLGNTVADLYSLLQNDARALALLGHNIKSVARLFQFELRKANDLPAVPVPAAVVDLAFPAPGLALVFTRDYGASIAQRYHVGRLGRGWVDNFDISLTNDSDHGVVTIRYGHTQRPFGKDKAGAYHGLPGDFATLTEVGGIFQLREKTGEVTVFRTDGMLDYLADTNGNLVSAGYTGSQLTRLTNSNGSALTLSYNSQGLISQVTDPAGRVAAYVYDASGNLLSVTTTAGTTEYSYTPDATGPRAHALTSIAFPAGTHLFFDYDSQGRLARQQRDGGAEPVTFIYSVASYRVRDALGNVAIVEYDDLGLTKRTWDGLSRRTTFSHSVSQNALTRITGPDGLAATFKYDKRGNPVRTSDPMGQEQQFEYEPNFNNVVAWEDALGRPTDFNYDPNGNPLSTTYPDGTIEEVGHDAQGNLVRAVNRRGQTVRYTYDANGLMKSKELPGGARVGYVYDARSNLLSATGPDGATLMEYDAADRMTKITYASGRFLEFAYDAGGRRIRSTDQSGFSVNYRYDAPGRLEELTDGSGQRLVHYEYDPVGRIASETRGNGTTTTYEYDAANQLLHLIHRAPDATILSRFDYTYDDNGRRTSMTTLEGTTEYVYDGAGQLILAALPGGRIIRYEYDEAGNRREVNDNGVTTAYTVNDMNQYLTVGSTNQAYDADGNLAFSAGPGGAQSYAYDAEGRLLSVVTSQGTWSYEYDVLGNRVATTHNGQRTEYLIDPAGLGDVVAEYDGSGNLRAHYAHGFGLVSRIDVAGPPAYYQFDAVGNTTELTGGGGAVLNTYSYLPFGESLSASEIVANPFEFAGEFGVIREGSGIDYMRNRWYDPAQGRFTQQDPIGLAGGANFYTYVGNRPVNAVDPSGLVDPITQPLIGVWLPGGGAVGQVASANTWAGSYEAAVAARSTAFAPGFEGSYMSAVGAEGSFALAPPSSALMAEVELAKLAEAGASDATLAAARAALLDSGATVAAQAAKAPSRLGIIGAAIQTGLALYSLKRGLKELAITGDLPACALPDGSIQRIFELCKGKSPGLLDILDQLHPLAGAITDTIQKAPSKDPNDISGPAGFGADRFLADNPILTYAIMFENIPNAEGPAAQVVITNRLDDDLDLDTFQLGDFGFGDLVVDVPDGRQFYSTRIDLRSTRGVFVDATAELDHQTRVVTWTLTALDPATLDIPIDPFTGFLPPDKAPPEGQGFVNYSVRPKADSPTGTRIDAQATIVFDTNDPIDTPLWTNTIDTGPPTSSVAPLPAVSNSTAFTVTWTGTDDADGTPGSGIATFDVFVSDSGGPFLLWLDDTVDHSAVYTGQPDHTYRFYSVATDNVGHEQATPDSAQAETTVDTTPPVLTNMPPDQTIEATMPSGAVVTFTLPTASDNLDPNPTVSCSPDSGSTFALGTTVVTCTATDTAGNTTRASFHITVTPATEPVPPKVTAVFVRSSDWNVTFLSALESQGLGDATFGFSIPTGASQFATLPWFNLNRISIRFSKNVNVALANLELHGVNVPTYALATGSLSYDSATFTATWSVTAGMDRDRLRINVDGDPAGVTAAGSTSLRLDGEWSDTISAFPSGNGTVGGDFAFRFNVLPADTNNDKVVNTTDLVLVKNNPSPPTAFQPRLDLNGSGVVDMTDFNLGRPRIGTVLPEPQLLAAAANQAGAGDVANLTQAELSPIIRAARQRWMAAGLSQQDLARFDEALFAIVDLPDSYLGLASFPNIAIDTHADGYGWFIDPTPLDDVEFSNRVFPTHAYATQSSAAAGRPDLLTTVMHEMGHMLGIPDDYNAGNQDNLMYGMLTLGERRLPARGNNADPTGTDPQTTFGRPVDATRRTAAMHAVLESSPSAVTVDAAIALITRRAVLYSASESADASDNRSGSASRRETRDIPKPHHGGRRDEILVGGDGDDLQIGGAGRDRLVGGIGTYRPIDHTAVDTIRSARGHYGVDDPPSGSDAAIRQLWGRVYRFHSNLPDDTIHVRLFR